MQRVVNFQEEERERDLNMKGESLTRNRHSFRVFTIACDLLKSTLQRFICTAMAYIPLQFAFFCWCLQNSGKFEMSFDFEIPSLYFGYTPVLLYGQIGLPVHHCLLPACLSILILFSVIKYEIKCILNKWPVISIPFE